MLAAWFDTFGEPSKVIKTGEFPNPTPEQGEVLVQLHASGVNPSDVKKRAGAFPNLLDDGAVVPHSDGAGVITAVGAGVDSSRIGERVFVYQAQYGRLHGTAAEYVAIDSRRAPVLPDQASFEIGACIGIPIMTAHRCVHADGPVAGQWVLVTGGAGRVGYYAIQWARLAGAKVIATASNAADTELCLSLGAVHVVNHREPGWGEQILRYTGGTKLDRVIDVEFGANLSEVLSCIRVGGVIATYSSTVVAEPTLPFKTMMFMDLSIRMVIVYAMPEDAKIAAVADTQKALSENLLQHRIAHILPLEETARSHDLIEKGGFGGCVVIRCIKP